MTTIDIKDGGLAVARSDTRSITVGVIDFVVTRGDAGPEVLRGYCRKDKKAEYINILKKEIVWEQHNEIIS